VFEVETLSKKENLLCEFQANSKHSLVNVRYIT